MICFHVRVLDHARRSLAALLLAGGAVVLAQAPALACPAGSGTTQTHVKDAADVFTGTVREVARHDSAVVYSVEVDRVYKGEVTTPRVKVATPASARACGLPDLATGRPYVFFAVPDASRLATDQRTGTAAASDKLVAQVERLLGTGHDPVPPAPRTAHFTLVGESSPTSLTRLAAPGAALVLAGLLGLLVVRRVSSRG